MNNKQVMLPLILISLLTLSTCLTSCNNLNNKTIEESQKEWVYVELITISPRDTTDYFYFGQMKKSIINNINANEEKKGLFTLSNIRLWNDDDLLELYEDEKLKGTIIFKIQDIQEVTIYKDDPVNLFDLEKLHESALKYRNKIN